MFVCPQLRYKEDLLWLRGIGCFMADSPEMTRIRDYNKFRVTLPHTIHTLCLPPSQKNSNKRRPDYLYSASF